MKCVPSVAIGQFMKILVLLQNKWDILVKLVICVLPGHRKIKTEIIKLLAFFCLNPVKYMLFHWILTMGHLIPPVVDQLQEIIGIWLSRQNAGNI